MKSIGLAVTEYWPELFPGPLSLSLYAWWYSRSLILRRRRYTGRVDISVVIVNYNSAAWVRRCADSIQRWTRGVEYELIIVDNASPDGSGPQLAPRFPQARVLLRPENGGFSAGANAGASEATGEFLLFVNPDVELRGDVVGSLWRYLREHPTVGAAGPRLLNADGSLQFSCRRFPSHRTALFNRASLMTRLLPGNRCSAAYLMSDWDHTEARDVDWLSGACLMVPRRIFERLGGFDEGFFFSAEDVDFCRRLQTGGCRVVYLPETRAIHAGSASSRSLPHRIVIARHQAMWRYYRKHLRAGPLVDALTLAGIDARCLLQLVLVRVPR